MTLSYSPLSRPTLEADLALARQNGDVATEADCLMALGDIAKENEEYDLAQGLYGQAWAAYERAGDIQGQANTLKILGDLFSKLWETQAVEEMYISAFTIYDYAQTLYRAINDIRGEAWLFMAKGHIEVDRDRTREASIRNYREAHSLFANIGDQVGETDSLFFLSVGLLGQGHSPSSQLHDVLNVYEQLENRLRQAQALEFLAQCAKKNKDFPLAQSYLTRAIALREDLGQADQEALLWLQRGHIAQSQNDESAAINHFDKALALSISIKDSAGVQSALRALPRLKRLDHDEISIWREVGNPVQEVSAMVFAGQQAQLEKNLSLARDLFEQALALDSQLYDVRSARETLLIGLGEVAQEEGDFATASECYKQLLEIRQWHGTYKARLLERLGNFLLRINEIDQAIFYLHKAGDTYLETPDSYRKGFILETIAHIERQRQNSSAARQALMDALTLFSNPHCAPFRQGVLWQLGVLEAEQHHDDEARRYFQQAWEIGLERSLIYKHIETRWHWGRFEWSRGSLQIGCDYCHQALALAAQNQENKMVQQLPLDTWQQELAAMNCPTPPDSESSHDT